jgi:DNA invertase Pin-like site-specific DNA recombinase
VLCVEGCNGWDKAPAADNIGESHAKGIDLYVHQQGIDTSTPAGNAMFQMLGVFAEFERAMIVVQAQRQIHRAFAGSYDAAAALRRAQHCPAGWCGVRRTDPGDAARIELLLAELRLPAIKQVWASLAAQADKEGWPAAIYALASRLRAS